MRRSRPVLLGCCAALLGAASGAHAQGADAARISLLYAQTCMACHTSAGSGAPQAGDAQAWRARVEQGMDALLEHTIDGRGGMPPLGSCMDCSEADFEGLIRFMSGAK